MPGGETHERADAQPVDQERDQRRDAAPGPDAARARGHGSERGQQDVVDVVDELTGIAVSALYAAGRTRAVALGVGAAAVLNLALNLALVPVIGITGSALATLVAYAALAVWAGQAAAPLVGTRLPWGAVALVAGATGALWALGQLADAGQVGGFALRVGVLALYPAALVAFGVYGRADVEAGLSLVRSRLGRGREPGA